MTEAEAYHEMYLTMARAAEQAIRLHNEEFEKTGIDQSAYSIFIILHFPSARPAGASPPVRPPVYPPAGRSPAWAPARTRY